MKVKIVLLAVFILSQLVNRAAAEESPMLDVTPMTFYFDKDKDQSPVSFSGTYTRLVITSKTGEATEKKRSMPYPASTTFKLLQYMVVAQQYDVNLSVKLKVGEYEETIPLVTLSRTSDKNGDSWIRDVTHDRRSFPWFVVHTGADASVPRITVDFSGSKKLGSGLAGSALQIALTGIKMVAPEATVVTRLSTNTAKDKAAAIDQALGKLFSNKLNERHTSERDLAKWNPEGGLQVQLGVPTQDGQWDGDIQSIGIWTITFAPPRASIFSDWALCGEEDATKRCKQNLEAAAREVRKEVELELSSVLAHPLIKTSAGDLSIKDYLLQQSWFSAAESALSGTEALDKWHADGLCRATSDAMLKLGLNSIDSKLVVMAVIKGMQHNTTAHQKTWGGDICKLAVS